MSQIRFSEQGGFDALASPEDIFGCFRLILGRFPHRQEWPGHSSRVGAPLAEVVKIYVNSLEFYNRGLLSPVESPCELVSLDGFRLYASREDRAVGGPMIAAGDYEPHMSRLFKERLKPGMRVLDVGANIGFYTMLAASRVGPQGCVIAVEPNPANVSLLLASRSINKFDNIRIVQAAASNQWDTLCLFPDGSNGTVAAVRPDGPPATLNTVMAFPLGALLQNESIDVIKIDVEGTEGRALQGMIEVIDRCRPSVFSEFTPDAIPSMSGMSADAYLGLFIDRGYRIHVLHKDGSVVDCGSGADRVIAEHSHSGLDHIDILCEAG